jgi:hypothetical protein
MSCPEFPDAIKAYKCYSIKNIRVNVHNFLTVAWAHKDDVAYTGVFPIALAYNGVKGTNY